MSELKLYLLFMLTFLGLSLAKSGTAKPNGNEASKNSLIQVQVDNPDRDEWRAIMIKVFGWDLSGMRPNEVLESLERANELYDKLRSEGSVSEYEHLRSKQVRNLIYLTKAVGFKCNEKSFRRFRTLRHLHQFAYMHVYPFIRHYEQLHFDECKREMISDLRESVNKLNEKTKLDVRVLFGKISTSASEGERKTLFRYIPQSSLNEGLLSFMELKVGPLKSVAFTNRESGAQYYGEQFKKVLVNELCNEVNRTLGPSIVNYNKFVYDKKMVKNLDEFTLEWVTYARCCEKILTDFDKLRERTYQILSERSFKPLTNKPRSIFSFFRPMRRPKVA